MGRIVHFLIVLFLLSSCAQIGSLSGGEIDMAPPQMLKSTPDTFQTNFNSTKIKIDFDEYIELKNPRKNVLITPVLRYDPLILASSKSLLIKNLDDSLWENTTYVIEFNEAIQDITESNPATGFRYVFSTGSYVDSLMVYGTIIDAYTLEPVNDAFVFLYENMDDSVPYIESPRYIGRTNKLGVYQIRNMKQGKYKVFACSDGNQNFRYDNPTEKIDFLEEPVEITSDSMPPLNFLVYQEEEQRQFMKGYSMLSPWSFYLSYNKRIDSLELRHLGKQNDIEFVRVYNEERDSVVFWTLDSAVVLDSMSFSVHSSSEEIDTITLSRLDDKIEDRLKIKFKLSGAKMDLGKDFEIDFDYPLLNVDNSKITLVKDSVNIPYELELNKSRTTLTLKAKFEENSKYKVIIDTLAFVDINGSINDSLVSEFSTPKLTFYGTLEIKVDVDENSSGILVVMDANDNAIESVFMKKTNKHYFEYMKPGQYKLKYIIDENENRRWDPGNYAMKTEPEEVKIYSGTITIRSNWDQEIEWKFN